MAPALHSPVSTLARAALWAATTTLLLTLVARQHPGVEACPVYYYDQIKNYCSGKPDFPESTDVWQEEFVKRRWCMDCEEADKKHGIFPTCGSGCDFFGGNCDVCRLPYTGSVPVIHG